MGTHRERQSPPARFRQWRRYRRILNRMLADELRTGPVSDERFAGLKSEARAAARRTSD